MSIEEGKEKLLEKSISFWFRVALRVMAWIILIFYMIFRICIPLVGKERLVLDKNDGYVMLGCIGLLLAIEAVKLAYEKLIMKKVGGTNELIRDNRNQR